MAGALCPILLAPEDQLETPGRPIIDKALLDHASFVCCKGRRFIPRREPLNFSEMLGGLFAASCSTMKMIVNQKKGCGIGEIGIPSWLVLRGFDPALMIKAENRGDWNKVEIFSHLVPAYCVAQVIPDEAIEVPKKIPSISLVTYGEVFRDSLRKPRGETPKAPGHTSVNKFMHEQALVWSGLKP